MGCTTPKRHTPLERRDTQIGVLTVSLIGLHLHDMPNQAHPNLKIRVSNQHFIISNMHMIGGSSMKAQQNTADTFNFVINSFYKPCGRSLQVGYFSDETILFYGAFDLNIIIDHKGEQQFRCILTDRHSERGYVLAKASFEPLSYYELNFRFQTATIRRRIGFESVAVRATIGQEILQTQYQRDIPQSPPYWEDKKYNFKVPNIVVKGYLQLINEQGDIVGKAQLILENLYSVKWGQEVVKSQELFAREMGSQVVVGDLKYSFMLGKSLNFSPRIAQLTSTITGKRYRNEGQTEIRSNGNE